MSTDGDRPLIFVRRKLEFYERPLQPAGKSFDTEEWVEAQPEQCQISFRLSMPGVDLRGIPHSVEQGFKYEFLKDEA